MFPCQEIRDMIVRDYPDFVRFNNLRQKKGLPRITWAEYSDLRVSGALRDVVEGLQDGGVVPYQDTLVSRCTASVGRPVGNQPPVLVLTKDMEVREDNNYEEVSILDASGPIHQEYEA